MERKLVFFQEVPPYCRELVMIDFSSSEKLVSVGKDITKGKEVGENLEDI